MRKLILTLALLTQSANAGVAKLHWTHDYRGTDGEITQLTGFNVYWGVEGTPLTNRIQYGPPMPLPWKIEGDMSHWSKTLENPAWLPGLRVCFRMTAVASELESAPSNTICKTFPSNPNQPIVVNIDTP
jgi:hypothetical protein